MKLTAVLVAAVVSFFLSSCASHLEEDKDNHGPVMIESAQPEYPEAARQNGLAGDVWLRMRVDTLGRVREVLVEKEANPILIEPALQAALKTKFTPALLNGKKIVVWYVASFHVGP